MAGRDTNPKDMNDDEIEDRYRAVWHSAIGNNFRNAEASLLAIEMNRRFLEDGAKQNHELALENKKLAEENHNLSRKNHNLTKLSILVSALALFFASTSVIFSFIDWRGDYKWQSQQIYLLEEMSAKSSNLVQSQESLNEVLSQLKTKKMSDTNSNDK